METLHCAMGQRYPSASPGDEEGAHRLLAHIVARTSGNFQVGSGRAGDLVSHRGGVLTSIPTCVKAATASLNQGADVSLNILWKPLRLIQGIELTVPAKTVSSPT